MSMTYYTVDDLRPGRSGWGVKRFSTLNDAISHYRSLPMDGARVLGMADDTHAYELIRCVRLFPGDAQGEDVLAADHWRGGLTKKNPALKDALEVCLETLRPRFLLEPERLIPVPQRKKPRKELREALLWQGYEENYDSASRAVFVGGAGCAWTTISGRPSACRSPGKRSSGASATWSFRKRCNGWRIGRGTRTHGDLLPHRWNPFRLRILCRP